MSLLFKHFASGSLNFAPPESNTGAIEDKSLSIDDAIKFLGEDETDAEEPKDKDGKKPAKVKEDVKEDEEEPEVEEDDDEEEEEEESDGEDDDLEEIEKEIGDEEVDDDKLELAGPLSRKEILKKYPDLFKSFPQLEKSYFRDREFTNIFTTIDEAKEAAGAAETLKSFDTDLDSGDTVKILTAVKNTNSKAFAKLTDNYLDNLGKVDQVAYTHVIGNIIKETIVHMVNRANKSSNDALREAAAILNQFVFQSDEFEPPKKMSVEEKADDPRERQIKEREEKLEQQYFTNATKTVEGRVDRFLKQTIEANIDPRKMMSDYIKGKAAEDALASVTRLINKDNSFIKLKDKLWEAAKKSNYSEESVDRIRRAFVAKAKTLLDPVIKKSRNEALRGIGKRVREEKEEVEIEEKETRDTKFKSSNREKPTPRSKGRLEDRMKNRDLSTLDLLGDD